MHNTQKMSRYAYDRMYNPGPTLSGAVLVIAYIYPLPLFSHMTDDKTSFWTPSRIGAVIGAALLRPREILDLADLTPRPAVMPDQVLACRAIFRISSASAFGTVALMRSISSM